MADIKQKIKLEGEKEYVAALREADRNLKTLKSALKAETAELGNNATEQEKNNVKAKNLKKQIAEQTKVVETQRKALAEVQKNYSDNAEAIALYEKKLYEARYTLADLQNQLDKTNTSVSESGQALKQAGAEASLGVVATKSFADSLGNIADVAGSISDSIQGIFEGMVSGIKGAIGEVWGDMMDLAARANDWEDLAATWNTTATNIQKWYHAVNASHNDFATLNSAVMRIATADPKKLAEYAKVSSENYTDQWQLAMAVMDSLAGMDYDEKLTAISELFGAKRVEGISDLVNDWGIIQENLDKFDVENGGIGLTQEGLDDMAKLAEQVSKIESTWRAFKDSVLEGVFGKFSLDMTSNVQGALDALIKFMNSDDEQEREQALKDLETNLTDFFRHLGEAIGRAAEAIGTVGEELAGSENSGVALIGRMLEKLADVLEWFTTEGNIDQVIHGLETLAAFWIAGKGLAMASKIASVVSNLAIIKGFSGLSGLLGGGAAGAAGAGSGAASGGGSAVTGAATGAAGGGAVVAVSNWIKGTVASAGSAIGSFLANTGGMVPAVGDRIINETNAGRAIRDGGDVLEGVAQDFAEKAEEVQKNVDTFWTDWLGVGINLAKTLGLVGGEPGKPQESGAEAGEAAYEVTEAQREAVEDLWDALREYEKSLGEDDSEYFAAEEAMKAAFEGQEDTLEGIQALVDWLYKQDGGTDQRDLPDDWFVILPEEVGDAVEEAVAPIIEEAEEILDESYTPEQKNEAAQDWWDAWKNANAGEEGWEEEERAYDYMAAVFGEEFAEVMDTIIHELDNEENQMELEDLPASWLRTGGEDGITRNDVQSMQGALSGLPEQVRIGAAQGVSGIRVYIDGAAAGRLIAPYVDQELGSRALYK